MKRLALLCLALLASAGASLGQLPVGALGARTRDLANMLARRVQFPGVEADEKITLQEIVDLFGERYEITILVNEAAFQAEGLADAADAKVARRAIPNMFNTKFSSVLQKVVSRIPVNSGATFLLRPEHIEITTVADMRAEIWGPDYQGPFLPLVNYSTARRSLRGALAELAERADFNIVLDVRVGDKADTPVSASFVNTPLDTAVRLLADMAGLRVALNENALYVSTEDRAVRLRSSPPSRPENPPSAKHPVPAPQPGPPAHPQKERR